MNSLLDKIFSTGIPAYIDLQEAKARSYAPNDPTPAVQNAAGRSVNSGQPQNALDAVPGGIQTVILAGVALVLVVVLIAGRMK
jgi:hypothetical protein